MNGWDADRVALAAGARLLRSAPAGPGGASVDTRALTPGTLFAGLPGASSDGGAFAGAALEAGAWGVLVTPEHARGALEQCARGAVLAHPDPLTGLQSLAREWRRELGARGASVIAVTGSTGKTSTKDILAALLHPVARVAATPQNLNTEIGMPLAILAAPGETEVLVLEMAMRGKGQIAELTAIAEPDVGLIVNIGPAHLELLGTIEAIAAAKAELVAGLGPGAVAVLPADEPLLDPHRRGDIRQVTFGEGGDVSLLAAAEGEVLIRDGTERIELRPSFSQAHNISNLVAAVAAARAAGFRVGGAVDVGFSAMRGERLELPGPVVVIDDCYNANPMSMRAALDDLVAGAPGRSVAVLGDMLELGGASAALHREIGAHAAAGGVGLLVAAGPLAGEIAAGYGAGAVRAPDAAAAAALLPGLLEPGDTVLVKGSRGARMERVVRALLDGELSPAAGPGRS